MDLNFEDKYAIIAQSAADAEQNALEWVVKRRRYFNPLECAEPKHFSRAIKPLSELALTCAIANRSSNEGTSAIYQELAGYIWNHVFANEAFREYLLRHAAGGYAYSLFGSLRQCGFDHPGYGAKLSQLLDTRYPSAIEQLPFVKLHFAYSLGNAGMHWDGLSLDAAYNSSFLASHPSPYDVTINDAYAITHVIFFLTDFARAQSSIFSQADREHFRFLLMRLLAYYVRRKNWDLTSEMLVCLKALGVDTCPVYIDAWLLLLASQNEDGSFTGPGPDEAMMVFPWDGGGAKHQAEEYFLSNYHTTLVALLALLVALPNLPISDYRERGG